jgi:Tfp pilus assembly protein PilO
MNNLMRSKRAVLALGTVLLVLVALAGWKFVISPELDAGNQAKATLDDTNLKITKAETDIASQCKVLTDIQTVLAQARNNQAKFPPTADVSQLFTQIRLAANIAGIPTQNITTVQAPAPAIGDITTVAEMPVTIDVIAKSAQVTNFLAALEAMPRSFIVTNMAVTGSSTAGSEAVTINGNAYIIQTTSLQDVLDQVNKAQVPIRQSCHLTELPPLAGNGAAGAAGATGATGDATPSVAPVTPTTAPGTNAPTTPVPPATTVPPTTTLPGANPSGAVPG